jgi:lysophospholipase L1-like esterase
MTRNDMSRGRWSARLAAVAALALVAGLTTTPATAADAPSQPPAPVYIALGDSYAAGTGGGAYIAPPAGLPAECLQTAGAYPALRNATLNLACAGATTVDVAAVADSYAAALKKAQVVTVTVGGNDVDAVQAAVACTASAGSPACHAALYNSLAVKLRELPGRISAMLDTIKKKAPRARIVLTGYPRLFTVSPALTAEQNQAASMMNSAADLLNATIGYSAIVNRVAYVGVAGRFSGHGIGSADPWLVPPGGLCEPSSTCSPSPFDAFHPSAKGYAEGYAAALAAARVP